MTPVVALESGTAKIQLIRKVGLFTHNVYPSPRNPESWDERCGNRPLWARQWPPQNGSRSGETASPAKSSPSPPASISRRLIIAEGVSPPQLDVPEHWLVRRHISTRVSIPAGKLAKQPTRRRDHLVWRPPANTALPSSGSGSWQRHAARDPDDGRPHQEPGPML